MKLRRRIVFCIILAALVISGAAFCIFFGRDCGKSAGTTRLVIKNAGSGKVYGKWFLEEKEEFAIEFIHSVNQSPVREFFRAENGLIRSVSVRFYSFGAGMQSDLEEGQTLGRDGDAMVISGLKTSFKALNYIVGTVSDHLLIIRNEAISLRDLCGRNAHISICLE